VKVKVTSQTFVARQLYSSRRDVLRASREASGKLSSNWAAALGTSVGGMLRPRAEMVHAQQAMAAIETL